MANNFEESSLFTRIDSSIKERMTLYITKAKLTKDSKANTQRKLIESAIHAYLINNPII